MATIERKPLPPSNYNATSITEADRVEMLAQANAVIDYSRIRRQHKRLVLPLDQAAHGAMKFGGESKLSFVIGILRANFVTTFF